MNFISFHHYEISFSLSSLSLLNLKASFNYSSCMSPSNSTSKNQKEKSSEEDFNYLERKYGKEPKISAKEYSQMRWNWH